MGGDIAHEKCGTRVAATPWVTMSLVVGAVLTGSVPAVAGDREIIGSPLASIGRYDSGKPVFTSYVRLSGPVPRKSSGTLLGAMRLNGLGRQQAPSDDTTSSFGFRKLATRGRRYCYAQSFAVFGFDEYPRSLRAAKSGDRARVEVLVAGQAKRLVGSTHLRPSRSLTEEAAIRRLGCMGPSG